MFLRDQDRPRDACDIDLTVAVGGINSPAGDLSVLRIDGPPVSIGNFKSGSFQRLLAHAVQLPHGQRTRLVLSRGNVRKNRLPQAHDRRSHKK